MVVPRSVSLPPEANLRRLAITLFAIIGLLLAAYLAADRLWYYLKPPSESVTVEPTVTLPAGWQQQAVAPDNDQVFFQAAKLETTDPIAPVVTVIVSRKPENVTPQEYSAQLVTAAETQLNHLVYEQNTFQETPQLAVRRLQGHYQEGDQPVGLKQQVYIRGQAVYTFTGIFTPDTPASTEVEMVFDQVLTLLGW